MQICKKCGAEIGGEVCKNCIDQEKAFVFNDAILGPINLKKTWYYRYFFPNYDETTLFVIGITILLIFLTNQGVDELSREAEKNFLTVIYISICGFTAVSLMIVHAFIKRKKSTFEKKLMLKFAIVITSLSGVISSIYAIENSAGPWVVFPIINIFNSFILLYLAKSEIINENNISDDNANIYEVLISAALIIIIYFISTLYFEHKWFITFSMCVAYATNFNITILTLIEKSLKIDLGITRRTI